MAKPKTAPDPRIKRLIDAFEAKHVAKHGIKPFDPQYPRFGRTLKDMLASASEGELLELMDDFFASRDLRILGGNWRPADFVYWAPRLRLKRNGMVETDGRTARNLDAAARATGRR